MTDPLGHATTYTYDATGRVTSVTIPKPNPSFPQNFTTTYSYDQSVTGYSAFRFTVITDPNGRITKQGYDQFGRLCVALDSLGGTTTYSYAKNHLTSVIDANGNETDYAYDAMNRLTSISFPNGGGTESYTYWPGGLLKTKTDRKNQITSYSWDAFKRFASSSTQPGLINVAYTYQGQKLTIVTDYSNGTMDQTFYSYDLSYRLSADNTLDYGYDAADRLISYAKPNYSSPYANYTRYPDGSLRTIEWSGTGAGQFFSYLYNLAGRYSALTMPNGQTRNYSYDDQGRLAALTNLNPSAVNLATYSYGYDVDNATGQNTMLGQRTSMTATVPSQGFTNALTKYYYDAAYELTRSDYPNVAPFNAEIDQWSYDLIGNRTTSTVNGMPTNYTYAQNGSGHNTQLMTSDGVYGYTYDPNGNTLSKTSGGSQVAQYAWREDDRLSGISLAATAAYTYDYRGRLRSKALNGGQPNGYVYVGLAAIEEHLLDGTPVADYVFGSGIDEPLAMSRGGQVYYYLADGLGSIGAITNAAASVQNNYVYDGWGQTRSQTGTLTSPYGYTGREFGEAGLLFYRARYYNPAVSRFLSADPSEIFSRLYTYADDSPVSMRDPSGLDPDTYTIQLVPNPSCDALSSPFGCNATFAEPSCKCDCVGPQEWRATVSLGIGGYIQIFNGDAKAYRKLIAKLRLEGAHFDPTVHDQASALAHELNRHIEPGRKAAQTELDKAADHPYTTSEECENACALARVKAIDAYGKGATAYPY